MIIKFYHIDEDRICYKKIDTLKLEYLHYSDEPREYRYCLVNYQHESIYELIHAEFIKAERHDDDDYYNNYRINIEWFENENEARDILNKLDEAMLEGKQLFVMPSAEDKRFLIR
jgi:hypothetical protein